MRKIGLLVDLLVVGAIVCLPLSAHAEALDAAPARDVSSPCPSRDVPPSSNALVRSLVNEWAVLAQQWCKVSRWDDPWPHFQDLLVRLLTGPGLHPTAGIVVPGSGVAAGLALNVPWNSQAPGYGRSAANVEGRVSENGFSEVGLRYQTLFATYVEGGRSPQLTIIANYLDLPRLPFYGFGNDTSRNARTTFGLREATVTPGFDMPLPLGFTLTGELAALWFEPRTSTPFDDRNNEVAAPGRHSDTTYLRPRIAATWGYPGEGVLHGFSTLAAVSYELDEALRGGAFSFNRLEARWNVAFGMGPDLGAIRFLSRLSLNDPHKRNRVPFYLQPTLGGADINDENLLRSYADYRFRAPNLIAYEISYERKIIDPLGLRVFGELGRVAREPGDLGFDGLKGSVGLSLTLRLGGGAVAELSFAWGGPEGPHIYATGNTNNVGGVTVGLRGVF